MKMPPVVGYGYFLESPIYIESTSCRQILLTFLKWVGRLGMEIMGYNHVVFVLPKFCSPEVSGQTWPTQENRGL